jgi:hypothetical protein
MKRAIVGLAAAGTVAGLVVAARRASQELGEHSKQMKAHCKQMAAYCKEMKASTNSRAEVPSEQEITKRRAAAPTP